MVIDAKEQKDNYNVTQYTDISTDTEQTFTGFCMKKYDQSFGEIWGMAEMEYNIHKFVSIHV